MLAKILSQVTLLVAATVLGAAACLAVTAAVFGGAHPARVATAMALWLLYASLLIVVMTLFSAAFRSRGAAAGAGLGFYFLTLLLSVWGPAARYSFLGLDVGDARRADGRSGVVRLAGGDGRSRDRRGRGGGAGDLRAPGVIGAEPHAGLLTACRVLLHRLGLRPSAAGKIGSEPVPRTPDARGSPWAALGAQTAPPRVILQEVRSITLSCCFEVKREAQAPPSLGALGESGVRFYQAIASRYNTRFRSLISLYK